MSPRATSSQPTRSRAALVDLARSAALVSTGRLAKRDGAWVPLGDPMEVALEVFAMRVGVQQPDQLDDSLHARFPFDPRRRRSSVVGRRQYPRDGSARHRAALVRADSGADEALDQMTASGLRVIAIARRSSSGSGPADVRGR